MIFVIITLLVFFIVVLFIKPRCPDCGDKMDNIDIDICHDCTVYKCGKCGKEWI